MNNLNSTCLHTLRLSNILVKNRKRTHPSGWDDEDSEDEESEGEDLDSAEWQTRRSTQIHKEDEAFLALTAFVRRSIPFRAEQQGKTGEELAPAFCGCPNLISITWDGNDSLPHSDGSREPQSSNLMVLMTAIIGYVAHLDHGFARTFLQPAGSFFGHIMLRKQALDALKKHPFQDRSLMPSGSLRWTTFISQNPDPSQLSIDANVRAMLRKLRHAQAHVPGAMARDSAFTGAESRQLPPATKGSEGATLNAAVASDIEAFDRALLAIASLGDQWSHAVKFHSIWLDILQKEVRKSAFVVLAAARTVGCQVEPAAHMREKPLPGWLRLPPELRSLCMQFLDEIYVPGFGDLGTGHALSRSQMQAILSFASDRRTIGYGRLNEVLIASKRLADEAAAEARSVSPSDVSKDTRSQLVGSGTTVQSGMFAVPKWSWKKAAERCMPQDWVTQAAWDQGGPSGQTTGASGPKFRAATPPEALAFLSVTDCGAFRNA